MICRQEEFKDRLEDLQQQFHTSKDELAKCKKEVAELEQRLQQKEAEVQAISKQVIWHAVISSDFMPCPKSIVAFRRQISDQTLRLSWFKQRTMFISTNRH